MNQLSTMYEFLKENALYLVFLDDLRGDVLELMKEVIEQYQVYAVDCGTKDDTNLWAVRYWLPLRLNEGAAIPNLLHNYE